MPQGTRIVDCVAVLGGAASDFLFDVGAEIFPEHCGGGKFVEVAHGDFRKEAHYGGERRGGMANESHADVVVERPARMMRDGVDDAFVGVGSREHAKNLRFVQKRIIESKCRSLRMALGENAPGNARRGATREREFFADGKLRQALEKNFLGHAADFRGRRRQQTNLHKIKKEKLAKQSEGDAIGRPRMARKTQAHAFIFLPGRMCGDGPEKRCGKIEAFEQNADVAFRDAGIGECGAKDFLGGIVKKRAERVAGSGARLSDAGSEFIFHQRQCPRCFCARVRRQHARAKCEASRNARWGRCAPIPDRERRRDICCGRTRRRISPP